MTDYALYAESGPRHKHTMVHVLDLLGCTAQGPTTEAALQATPQAIREFLGFLKRHGDSVDPKAPFTISVKAHVTKGSFIGQGNPVDGFPPDYSPLSEEELRLLVARLRWLREDLTVLIRQLTSEQLTAEPVKARSLTRIIEHLAESSGAYLRYTVGSVVELSEALRGVRNSNGDVTALTHLWAIDSGRWGTLSETERGQRVPHGQQTWTARRGLRRALEHEWEHLTEMRERVG